jgi:hypothetical protein
MIKLWSEHGFFFSPMKALKDEAPFPLLSIDEAI